MMLKNLLSLAAASCAATLFATTVDTTLYVDKSAAPGGDGETPETAFATIAAALDKAQSGWTVKVAPGDYDSEETVDADGYTNRVYITKKVHLLATGGKDVTHIVGKRAAVFASASYPGIGADAVRCVRVDAAAYGTVVEGFTLRDGGCHTTADDATGYAGGFLGGASNRRFYLVDCVVSNCVGNRGGALRWGTAVRCRISGNAGGASAGRVSNFANCLITGNDSTGGNFQDCSLVQCTVAGNVGGNCFGGMTSGGYKIYNCVFANNQGFCGSKTVLTLDGCVLDASSGTSSLSYAGSTLGNSIVSSVDGYHFIAPLVNDWRLLPDDSAIGLAKVSNIALAGLPTQDDVDYYADLAGLSFAASTTVNAGALQTPGPTPATGALQFTVPAAANGEICNAPNLYAFGETAPAAFRVKPALEDGQRVFCAKRETEHGTTWFPEMDDSFYMLAPPAGVIVTNEVLLTEDVLYVSETGTDDENDGRDPGRPLKTLQKAADLAPAYAVVSAAAGTYDEGGAVRNGVSNRLYTTKQIRIVGAGIGKSIIKGAADPDNPSGIPGDGRGPKACRCVCLGNIAAVQGFTLTDGHTDYQSETADPTDGATRGGGFSVDSQGSQRPVNRYLLDCAITNCSGRNGGGVYCGTLIRCRISDCFGANGGLRYAQLISCVLDHASDKQTGNLSLYSGGCSARQCTFIENAGEPYIAPNGANSQSADYVTNSVFLIGNGKIAVTSSRIGANVYCGTIRQQSDRTNIEAKGGKVADPLLYRPLDGDGRLLACSPALGTGVLDDNSYTWFTSGFGGDDVIFTDGRPAAGAFQTLVDAVVLESPRYGNYGALALTNGVAPGETLTVKLSGSTRPCAGFVMDGVTNASDTASFDYTGSAKPVPGVSVSVEPLYLPHWYVDADHGDDANSGFTAKSAKKTLKGVMDLGASLYDGDTVHAAEGVYREKEMKYGTGAKIGTRVVVPNGVTLLADGDREKTVIEGKAATNGDELGLGDDAVRCVALSNYKSVIRGFTLRGGRTSVSGTTDGVDYNGGGVYTTTASANIGACVIDCVITNCAAARGGGGFNRIDYIGCLFVDNRALNGRAAMSKGAAFNCVFTRNRGGNCVQGGQNIVNCTFFDNYANPTDDTNFEVTYDIAIPDSSKVAVYNTIAKGPVKGSSTSYFYASNCLFNATYDNYTYKSKNFYDEGTVVADESVFVFSPDGKLLSSDHPAVDATDAQLNADIAERFSTRMDFTTDGAGGQRVFNAKMDIGACEYDWRGEYAKAIGGGVTVTEASPDVKLENGKVTLTDGCEIAGTWSLGDGAKNVKCSAAIAAVGGGTLSGELTDGADFTRTLSATDGADAASFKTRLTELGWSFAYAGAGSGAVGPFDAGVPGFLLLLR